MGALWEPYRSFMVRVIFPVRVRISIMVRVRVSIRVRVMTISTYIQWEPYRSLIGALWLGLYFR